MTFLRAWIASHAPRVAIWMVTLACLTAHSRRVEAQATPASLEALLAAYKNMAGLEAEYVEHKYMSLLAQPLESHGHIYFARPAYLLRKVDKPFASSVVITDKEVRISDDQGQKTIDLQSRADVRPFVESLVWLLSGNAAALQKAYSAQFVADQNQQGWQLSLTPKGPPLSRIISRMQIKGEGLQVKSIEVHETSGDKSIMTIVAANPERSFSDEERTQLFGKGKSKSPQ